MTIILYGIKNCDTMKKARLWLDGHDIAYRFHDYRRDGLDSVQLQAWEQELGWERLLNRRGTTWRKLPQATRDSIDREQALDIMLANPAIIKRPLLDLGDRRVLGFSPQDYTRLFEDR